MSTSSSTNNTLLKFAEITVTVKIPKGWGDQRINKFDNDEYGNLISAVEDAAARFNSSHPDITVEVDS